ncbi:integrase/recombinase XerC [Dyadobacter jejuensis]|uniref:Tyrosine recombinase XerC n=1 Tax=Dyadobacter jejuensis TaxID=1082580 RepID=A0A316ARF3_9BACT|nr:tyrosine-type recombinase/integrase [Dyadobacter jejuensis]PWJ59879.1 integrase/recombinase XerC [Dyadobacter jejuensis]
MIKKFIDFLTFEKRSSAHTIKAYQTDLEQLRVYLAAHYETDQPEEAQSGMLRSWIVALMEQGINPTSINRKIASIRSFYAFLRKKKVILKDPSSILVTLKTRKKLPEFIEEKGIAQLFEEIENPEDFAGIRDQAVLELLYGTGIRLSELLSIRTSDINLYSHTLRVLGKRGKERIVPLTGPLSELLPKYLSMRAPSEPTDQLIITDSGKPAYPMYVQRLVKKHLRLVTTLGQKSPHTLRHSYATHLLNRGADLNAIKELLGHTNLAATQIYTHNTIEKLKKSHQDAHPKS